MTSASSRHAVNTIPGPIRSPAAQRLSAAWRELADCRQADPELFFPIGSAGKAATENQRAKAFCKSCPVQQPCLAYALITHQQYGIWGGCDENERRSLYRQWRETRTTDGSDRSQP